ncbi:hypothetical protein Brsp07_04524 [Brucella sp. NBRC 14130]|uniref:hypothetical protein n=1 Tax=Brucella sp. NBRC 14130 TaxID=3075483 RepID=UPI0030B6075B
MDGFVIDDGGRAEAGFKGKAGDCVARSLAIVTGRPYAEIYAALAKGTGAQRATARSGKRAASARNGINTKRKWFRDYAASLGLEWVPTMKIGSGCTVHLTADELPPGRLVVVVSGHYTAMIDGVIHDTHDPRREIHAIEPDRGQPLKPGQWRNENGVCSIQRRCVYGYFRLAS